MSCPWQSISCISANASHFCPQMFLITRKKSLSFAKCTKHLVGRLEVALVSGIRQEVLPLGQGLLDLRCRACRHFKNWLVKNKISDSWIVIIPNIQVYLHNLQIYFYIYIYMFMITFISRYIYIYMCVV